MADQTKEEKIAELEQTLRECRLAPDLFTRIIAAAKEKGVITKEEAAKAEEFLLDNILTEARISREYDSGLKTGREQTLEQATRWLTDKAGQAFIQDKDEDAEQLRSLAKKLKTDLAKK